ncbi:hypothetical protein RRG08_024456 [Elysia crispata]|uniref:Antistasin-like domain-containing protein n=1 Tax=Elysia crispata TaxID=231223 RepID=A0AAE1D278_9GAST|nr:hypothetical protein RRG08_024456 [Elysia crispata]
MAKLTAAHCLLFALIHITDARFLPIPCFSLLGFECPGGRRWDPGLCQCVPDRLKCVVPMCPVRPHSSRCMIYKLDFTGCPTCSCECDELSQICPINCPRGVEMISRPNGCKECKCRDPKICKRILCENRCPFGHLEDVDGCPTCSCKSRRNLCPPVLCSQMCPYGTIKDTNGCPTCICKPKPICATLFCDNFCANGRKQDSNGCEVSCECKPIRLALICPRLACEKHCPNGTNLDNKGCPTCSCKNHPVAHNVLILEQLLSKKCY